MSARQRKLRAIGANIFAGGFTLGVRRHFDVLMHLEHDGYGAAVSHANLGLPVVTDQTDWRRVLKEERVDRVDFLYSNPPCAIWSTASGVKRDWRLDPRLQRIRDIFELVDVLEPTVWCWESVCQAFTRGRDFVDELIGLAQRRGYSATYLFINARWHGVPQERKRFFLVLHKVAIDWQAPDYALEPSAYGAIRAVDPGEMKPITNKLHLKLLKKTKPGGSLRRTFVEHFGEDESQLPRNRHGKVKDKPSFLIKRLPLEGPGGVVVGDRICHPVEPRLLTINELKALCGFPPGYDLRSRSGAASLLARGVMPPVGEWLAANVAAAVRRGKKLAEPATYLADFREPPGRVERVAAGVVAAPSPERASGRQARPGRAAPAAPKLPRAPKMPPVDYDRLEVPAAPKGAPMGTSGEFIRYLLKQNRYPDEVIAAMVRRNFAGRKTTVSDVSWNRQRLKRTENVAPPRVQLRRGE